jgi:hypothetical protein
MPPAPRGTPKEVHRILASDAWDENAGKCWENGWKKHGKSLKYIHYGVCNFIIP